MKGIVSTLTLTTTVTLQRLQLRYTMQTKKSNNKLQHTIINSCKNQKHASTRISRERHNEKTQQLQRAFCIPFQLCFVSAIMARTTEPLFRRHDMIASGALITRCRKKGSTMCQVPETTGCLSVLIAFTVKDPQEVCSPWRIKNNSSYADVSS